LVRIEPDAISRGFSLSNGREFGRPGADVSSPTGGCQVLICGCEIPCFDPPQRLEVLALVDGDELGFQLELSVDMGRYSFCDALL